jgi:hypothetical protein
VEEVTAMNHQINAAPQCGLQGPLKAIIEIMAPPATLDARPLGQIKA